MKKHLDSLLVRCLIIAAYLVGAGLMIWHWKIQTVRDEQSIQITQLIRATIREQAQKDLLVPKVIVLSAPHTSMAALEDSMIHVVSSILASKYLSLNKEDSELQAKPYFIFPNKADKRGNYVLTESQLSDLRAHIDFLSRQVETEVDRVKAEFATDIDKLNTWVTIWIGVIGFLGIFVPVVLNIDVSNRSQEASDKSNEAFKRAESASTKASTALEGIQTVSKQLEKIAGIEKRISGAEITINFLDEQSKSASEIARAAESKSNALHLVYAIDRLDNFRPENLKFIHPESRIPFLKEILESISAAAIECRSQCENSIVKEAIFELVRSISRISYQKFIDGTSTAHLDSFVNQVTQALSGEYDQPKYDEICSALKKLIQELVLSSTS